MSEEEYKIFEPNDKTEESEKLPCGVCFGASKNPMFYKGQPICRGCNNHAI